MFLHALILEISLFTVTEPNAEIDPVQLQEGIYIVDEEEPLHADQILNSTPSGSDQAKNSPNLQTTPIGGGTKLTITKEVIRKKKTGHKLVKSSPFEELAAKKARLVDAELEFIELKKKNAQEIHELTIQQMKEEHEWKKSQYSQYSLSHL